MLAFGAVVAALGFALPGVFDDPTLFIMTSFIIGCGHGGLFVSVVIVALGKVVQPAQRSFIMLGTAGLGGHVSGAPIATTLIGFMGWGVSIFPVFIRADPAASDLWARVAETPAGTGKQYMGCGQSRLFRSVLHLVICWLFVWISRSVYSNPTGHIIMGIPDNWRMVLALIGLFNIAGSFLSGWSGQVYPKPKPLWYLSDTCNCHYAIYHRPTRGHERSVLASSNGDFVAVHRTANHGINRADPRIVSQPWRSCVL